MTGSKCEQDSFVATIEPKKTARKAAAGRKKERHKERDGRVKRSRAGRENRRSSASRADEAK